MIRGEIRAPYGLVFHQIILLLFVLETNRIALGNVKMCAKTTKEREIYIAVSNRQVRHRPSSEIVP
jgi:hypothetical protein